VSLLRKAWQTWRQDRLLQLVTRNSGYLFSSNGISSVITATQGFLAALLLGPADFAVLGMVITYASSVNRLLSFRMGELVIKYSGQYLALGRKDQAAAVIKTAGISEAITSVFAYLLLVLSSQLASVYIIKDPPTQSWINFYALALLVNLMTETSTAVLQVGGHYRSQALLNLCQSVLTGGWILIVFLTHGGLYQVLIGYLAGKAVFGLGVMAMAFYWMKPLLGEGWWRISLGLLTKRREMLKFAVSTNLSGTINMIIRDSEILWVGFFTTKLQAGYYKFALAVMNVVLMPVSAMLSSAAPEVNRLVATRAWGPLRRLLRRTSMIALAWTGVCTLGIATLGYFLLGYLKQGAYLPAFPAILILLAGYGVANVAFWNRPLLLAFGLPLYPMNVTAVVGVVKTALMFVLVGPLGFLAEAALLSGYLAVSVGLIVQRGMKELRHSEQAPVPQVSAGE
jgi:O-antigen/teichoic acid export membrane protein